MVLNRNNKSVKNEFAYSAKKNDSHFCSFRNPARPIYEREITCSKNEWTTCSCDGCHDYD